MIWLAAYDIEDDGERAKAAAILQAWGFVRVQRSLYVGRAPRGVVQDLVKTLGRHVKTGHVVLVPVTEELLSKALEHGAPPYAPLRPPSYKQTYVV